MPLKNGRLTPKEQEYARFVAAGVAPIDAARKAGYSNAEIQVYQIQARPELATEVQRRLVERAQTHGFEVGLETLIEIAADKQQPGGARVSAAKVLVDRGWPEAAAGAPGAFEDMTPEQLEAARAALFRKLADLAAPVIEGEVRTESAQGVFD
jgi:hypothetical protein